MENYTQSASYTYATQQPGCLNNGWVVVATVGVAAVEMARNTALVSRNTAVAEGLPKEHPIYASLILQLQQSCHIWLTM